MRRNIWMILLCMTIVILSCNNNVKKETMEPTQSWHWEDGAFEDYVLGKNAIKKAKYAEADKLFDKAIAKAIEEKNLRYLLQGLRSKHVAQQYYKEDVKLAQIKEVDRLLEKLPTEVDRHLYIYRGYLLGQYAQHLSYEQRGKVATSISSENSDYENWSQKDFTNEARKMYLTLLEHGGGFVTIPAEKCKDFVMSKYDEDRYPTLLDLYTNDALRFYKDYNSDTHRSPYFLDASVLIDKEYSEHKTSIQEQQAIHQNLVSLLAKDYSCASKRRDTELLKWQLDHLKDNKSEEIYTSVLKSRKKASQDDCGDWYTLALGRYYVSHDKVKAKEILEDLVGHTTIEPVKKIANASLRNILNEELDVQSESTYTSNEKPIVRIGYRNVHNMYVRIYKCPTSDLYEAVNGYSGAEHNKRLKIVTDYELVYEDHKSLPDFGDYDSHSVEYIADRDLDYGYYFMVISSSDKFTTASKQLLVTPFWVTDIQVSQYGNTQQKSEHQHFLVNNRITGQPISQVEVKALVSNYKRRKTSFNSSVIGQTSSDGTVSYAALSRNNYRLDLSKGRDRFITSNGFSQYYRNQNRPYRQTTFYTDRSIYRPGQTLYFKALLTNRDGLISEVLPSTSVTVSLHDANGQEVGNKILTSNALGAIDGSFLLPEGRLSGHWSLRSSVNGHQGIRVETYKRPGFLVNVKHDAQASDDATVVVTGNAETFNVLPLREKPFQYTVYLKRRWCYFWRQNDENERDFVTSGQGMTDADGHYTIKLPQQDVEDDPYANLYYAVEVQVEDSNGEIQRNQMDVPVGKQKYSVSNPLEELRLLNNLTSKELEVKDSQGEAVNTQVVLQVESLNGPERDYKNPVWPSVDTSLYSVADFEKNGMLLHPDRRDAKNWSVASTVYENTYATPASINWKAIITSPGVYKITLSGENIAKRSDVVQVIREGDKMYFTLMAIEKDGNHHEVGDQVVVKVRRKYKGQPIFFESSQASGGEKGRWLRSDEDQIVLTINPEDRGNFFLKFRTTGQNRHQEEVVTISVPWTNKQLDVGLTTYRKETKPGSKENYCVTIKDPHGKFKGGELLAVMYDASLNKIVPHNWSTNSFFGFRYNPFVQNYDRSLTWPIYHHNSYWNRRDGKGDDVFYPLPHFYYDNDAGFNRMHRSYGMKKEMSAVPMAKRAEADEEVIFEDAVVVMQADDSDKKSSSEESSDIEIRRNLDELVFFYPAISINDKGQACFEFIMNDALTKWELQLLAHDRDLRLGHVKYEVITKKDLLTNANYPRFLRQGDRLNLAVRMSQLTDSPIDVNSQIKIFDAITGEDLTTVMTAGARQQTYRIAANGDHLIHYDIQVPEDQINPIKVQLLSKSSRHTDGEEKIIPILSSKQYLSNNRVLHLQPNDKDEIDLDQLVASLPKGAMPAKLTLEFTPNPSFFALKSLPFMEYKSNKNVDFIAERFFVNATSKQVMDAVPNFKNIYRSWITSQALESPLLKNPDLKVMPLEQTAFLSDAMDEKLQAELIDQYWAPNAINEALTRDLRALTERQNSDGGFSWFPGGRSSLYVSMRMLYYLGWKKELVGDQQYFLNEETRNRAIKYVQEEFVETHKRKDVYKKDYRVSSQDIQFLMVSRMFPSSANAEAKAIEMKLMEHLADQWTTLSHTEQAKVALLGIWGKSTPTSLTKDIWASMKNNQLCKDNLGCYWKAGRQRYGSATSKIELQSLSIYLAYKLGDKDRIPAMQQYLLSLKRTQQWRSSAEVALAFHMLNLDETWDASQQLALSLDGKSLVTSGEAGSGYFRKSFDLKGRSKLGKLSWHNASKHQAWGGIYVQYYQSISLATENQQEGLSVEKHVYQNVAQVGEAPSWQKITNDQAQTMARGDRIKVVYQLETDRDMSFMALRDFIPAIAEQGNQLSTYQYRGGLSYYVSLDDAHINYFIDYMPKGKYELTFEYDMTRQGSSDSGYAELQSFYAPEFSARSETIRMGVEK